jgi:hypothetical protein
MMLDVRTQGGRELGEAGCRSLWWALEPGVAVDLRHIEDSLQPVTLNFNLRAAIQGRK